MWTRVAVPLLLSAFGASGVSVDIENGVYKLKASTFGKVISKFPAVMVMFYSVEPSYGKDYDKAARKLKKIAPAENGGARLAKVDVVAEPGLKEQFGVEDLPTLLVFKGGELFETYRSGIDKEDFVAYMKAMAAEPAAIGTFQRYYQLAYASYKEQLRLVFPASVRKHLFKIFPLMLGLPLLLFLFCMCCKSRKQQNEVATKKGGDAKRAKRSESPAPKGKDDEGEAKEEPKDEGEKKED